MSVIRPQYLTVHSGDVDRFGFLGAYVLALMDYVTSLTEERNGRLRIDGTMWWRVSYADLAASVGGGVTRTSAYRAVAELEAAGVLLSCFPRYASKEDQTKAYRRSGTVPDTGSEQSFSASETARAVISHQRNRTVSQGNRTVSPVESSPLLEELEEGGRRRGYPGAHRNAHPVPGPANAPPPKNSNEEQEPTPYCPTHMPYGTDTPCGPCRNHRITHQIWLEAHPNRKDPTVITDEQRAQAQARRDCQRCEGFPVSLDNGARPCRPDNPIPGCPTWHTLRTPA